MFYIPYISAHTAYYRFVIVIIKVKFYVGWRSVSVQKNY